MLREPIDAVPAIPPTIGDIRRVWRGDRCVHRPTADVYVQSIRWFRTYCAQRSLDERAELTLDGARRFVAWYARHRGLNRRHVRHARSALYALSRVYHVMALSPPAWEAPRRARVPTTAVLRAFAKHLARHRGSPERTVHKKLDHVGKLMKHLAMRGTPWRMMALRDIDEFLIACARRYARSTVADIACTVRSFTRFLLATDRIARDLADSIIAPVQPKFERPSRALPWEDVQRLVHAVDRSTARGLRDHALLLLMSTYGFGAGEAIRLQLQDVDWIAATLTVVRPKTGVTFTLPLLPAVAKVLARYLRAGRPPHTPSSPRIGHAHR